MTILLLPRLRLRRLQAQLNRLSTEWTRFQASLLNGDAAAKVMKQLASGMKVLADHGAEIASIVSKGIQWAVWTAGVYAAIKALSGLRAAVTAAKAALVAFNVSSVAAAVGSLSGLLGPAGLAAAAGAAIVALPLFPALRSPQTTYSASIRPPSTTTRRKWARPRMP